MSGIILDARALQDLSAYRGIGTYVRGLLEGLDAAGGPHPTLLLQQGEVPPESGRLGLPVHARRLRPLNRHVQPILDPIQVGYALRTSGARVYHAVEYAQPLAPPMAVVVTIHDLIPFVMPSLYPWMRRERWPAMRRLRHADAVIAVSAATARDAVRIADVDPAKVTVVPEGVRAAAPVAPGMLDEVRRRLRLPPRFVLAVGTFDPRKRIGVLAGVVAAMRRDADIGLVIAGFQGNFETAVHGALERAGVAGAARVLGHVSAADLAALYAGAELLLFTSAYEGFGLPLLEAMAAGLPVVAFANSSLPEVAGGAAVLVPDGDAAAMTRAALGVLAPGNRRDDLIARGRSRAAELTWERAARATRAVWSAVQR